jgi:Papain family cysteine protease
MARTVTLESVPITHARPFGLGALPSPPNPHAQGLSRTKLKMAITVQPGQIIPVDHRASFPPIQQQGGTEDCVLYSACDAAAALIARKLGKHITPSHIFTGALVRMTEHTFGQNVGTYPVDAFVHLVREGLCHSTAWPDGTFFHDIDPHAWKTQFAFVPDPARRIWNGYPLPHDPFYEGAHERMTTWRRVAQNADAVQEQLANGFDVTFGFQATEELWGVGSDGNYAYPDSAHVPIVGGHDMCVVGRLADGRWICRNSYGGNWGDHGYCYLDAQWFDAVPPAGRWPIVLYDLITWHAVA